MVLGRLFRRNAREAQARSLYLKVVEQARRPEFYRHCGVPDTLDGRFELIALHAFLVLHRLKSQQSGSADLAQALFDTLFLDMDQSLRELGAGDLGVGRRVKQMAQGLYGRIAAYEAGLHGPGDELQAALRRNLYGTVQPGPGSLESVADYLRREADALAQQNLADLMAGELAFGDPPEAVAEP
jgi:cytochrome b pre-mRNA-processing protein 3